MSIRLAISDLVMNRTLAPGDDVSELAAHIQDSGLKFPILVSPRDNTVIDGLRRVEAVRLLGNETIDAVIPSTLREALDHLAATLAFTKFQRPVGPRRMAQTKRDIVPVVYFERANLNRGVPVRAGTRPRGSVGDQSLIILARMFGVTKSTLGVIGRVFALEGTDPPGFVPGELQDMLDGVERGEVRPGSIINRLQQKRLFKGDIRAPQDQRDAMKVAMASLNGVLHGIGNLGPLSTKLTTKELQDLRASLVRLRQFNNQIINALNEEINKR